MFLLLCVFVFKAENCSANVCIRMHFTADNLRSTRRHRAELQYCIAFISSKISSSFYLYTYDLFFRSLFSVHIAVIGSIGASSQFCLTSIVNYANVWLILTRAAISRMPSILFLCSFTFSFTFSFSNAFGVKQYRLFGNVLFCSV